MNQHEDEDDQKRSRCRTFCRNHFKSVITLIMIFGTITVIVLIVMVHKWKFEQKMANQASLCQDVVVVGAGVAGAYAAWQLRDQGLRVHVYEISNRVGGRLHSKVFPSNNHQPDLTAEFGAEHFEPRLQPLLNHTIHALNLSKLLVRPQSQSFPLTYYLRSMTLKTADLKTTNKPYILSYREKHKTPEELKRMYILNALSNDSVDPRIAALKAKTRDGRRLHSQGYWNVLGLTASMDGYHLVYDTSPRRSELANDNAALLASIPDTTPRNRKTLRGGMQQLPVALMEGFLTASENRKLSCIHRKPYGYRLTFTHVRTSGHDVIHPIRKHTRVCARKVVLALPKPALKHVQWGPLHSHSHLRKHLGHIRSVPVIKVFFMYNTSWWTRLGKRPLNVITDLPIRRTAYLGARAHNQHLFLVAEPDDVDTDYFQGMLHTPLYHGNASRDQHVKDLVRHVTLQLARVYGVPSSSIPQPCSVMTYLWSKSASGHGWGLWHKGVNFGHSAAAILHPVKHESVYIVGSDYSEKYHQLNIEGALQSVQNVLNLWRKEKSKVDVVKYHESKVHKSHHKTRVV